VTLHPDACLSPDDPSAERIWAAVRGELSPEETEAILDRVADSPACAEIWDLARQLNDTAENQAPIPRPQARRRLVGWLIPPSIAATILIALGLVTFLRNNPKAPTPYRGARSPIHARMVDGASLPRDRCLLSWDAPAAATQFTVKVLTADGQVVLVQEGVRGQSFRIPAERLSDLPDGALLLWQVTAHFPDGSLSLSPIFHVQLGTAE